MNSLAIAKQSVAPTARHLFLHLNNQRFIIEQVTESRPYSISRCQTRVRYKPEFLMMSQARRCLTLPHPGREQPKKRTNVILFNWALWWGPHLSMKWTMRTFFFSCVRDGKIKIFGDSYVDGPRRGGGVVS